MDSPPDRKVSLIVTVKNESSSIEALLASVASQTMLPDEMIVVDGGSTDDTLGKINRHAASSAFPIKAVSSPGANIPEGRNIGVRESSFGIIAMTDAGCRLDKGWVEGITKPIRERRGEVAIGLTLGWYKTEFQEVCSHILTLDMEHYKSHQPKLTARSLAFTREAWQKAGGFPEATSVAEDTAFGMNLKKASVPIAYAPDAIVFWRPRGTIGGVFRQFYGYSKADGFRGLSPIRYLARCLAVLILAAFLFVFWWSPWAWGLALLAIIAEMWFLRIRLVPRLSPRRLWLALKISFAMELGLTLGYIPGILSRLTPAP